MSNGNVTNFPRESTIRELVDLQRADLAGNGYLGSRVTIHDGNVSIDDRFVQKV